MGDSRMMEGGGGGKTSFWGWGGVAGLDGGRGVGVSGCCYWGCENIFISTFGIFFLC
jgi:hypothetical protein